MPADLLAICFQLNCQPWVWPKCPFIPSAENKCTCTKHPPCRLFQKDTFPPCGIMLKSASKFPDAGILPLCRSVCSIEVQALIVWKLLWGCQTYSSICLVNIGQHLKNLHFASLFEELIEICLQMWPEPPHSISVSYHMICIDVKKQ